jgi:hypothetical protein
MLVHREGNKKINNLLVCQHVSNMCVQLSSSAHFWFLAYVVKNAWLWIRQKAQHIRRDTKRQRGEMKGQGNREVTWSRKKDICIYIYKYYIYIYIYIYCTEVWTQGLHLKLLYQPVFVMGFFKIGSHKLFAQAGFKLQSFWSLPPEYLGLQVWATGPQHIYYCINDNMNLPLMRLLWVSLIP